MTSDNDRSAHYGASARHDISGVVTDLLLRHVRKQFGQDGVARMLSMAGESRSVAILEDHGSWNSHGAVIALFAAAAEVTGDQAVARRVGETIFDHQSEADVAQTLHTFGSPAELLHNVAMALGGFTTVATLEPVEVSYAHAVVQARTGAGFRRHRYLCDFTKGLLSQVPSLFGLQPAEVEEPECQATGGRFCSYRLSWEDRQWSAAIDQRSRLYAESVEQSDVTTASAEPEPDDAARASALRGQVDDLTEQLEGAYSTAADLLAPQDIDAVLARITTRAAHAVNAQRYLLTVRTGPDSPSRLHHRGFSEAEATALAGTLLSDHPDDRDGSWLIVDIASSSRFYGRLAAVFPNGGRYSADERCTLELYANYAAAALDVVTALDEVRRSDSMSRALLGFSRRLAQAGSPDDVAGTLTGGVTSVLGADRSAVWLWDAAAECLRLRSRCVRHVDGTQHIDEVQNIDQTQPDVPAGEAAPGATGVIGSFSPWFQPAVTSTVQPLYLADSSLVEELHDSRAVTAVWSDDARFTRANDLFVESDLAVALVAPLRTGDEFLGVVTAEFTDPALAALHGGVHAGQSLAEPATAATPSVAERAYVPERTSGPADLARPDPARHPMPSMFAPRSTTVADGERLFGRPPAAAMHNANLAEAGDRLPWMTQSDTERDMSLVGLAQTGTGLPGPAEAREHRGRLAQASEHPGTAEARTQPAGLAEAGERLAGLADQAVTAMVNTRLLEQVSHLAWHDDLTGLPNRRLLEDRANQELLRSRRTGEPMCVFFIDLDRFKQVNDTLGHAAGDELIVEVARRLSRTVRGQDTVARLGGDELAVLLPNLGPGDDVDHLARRALDALHAPYVIAGRELHTSASIGIAMAPEHGETWDELLSAADEAMYRSKRLGRDTFQIYRSDLGYLPTPDLDLQTDLRHALQRGELFVVYQPIVDLRTGNVNGVEALVRWAHPRRGILQPSSFVPLAEESNLVVTVDSWVIAQACRQVQAWDVVNFRLVVNASSRDLASDDYVETVTQTLVDTEFDPHLLEIDINETIALDSARHNMERLRRLGVRFAIDDFGTGTSSLADITELPVSTVKIDQSYVQILAPGDGPSTMASAIATMARELHLDCVAEGVETPDQFRILVQRGCSAAQGFFFSPPLPAEGLRQLLRRPGALANTSRPSAIRPDAGATV